LEANKIAHLDDIWCVAATIFNMFAETGWRKWQSVAEVWSAPEANSFELRVPTPTGLRGVLNDCFAAAANRTAGSEEEMLTMESVAGNIGKLLREPAPRLRDGLDDKHCGIIYNNLGLGLHNSGFVAEARAQYENALRVDSKSDQSIEFKVDNSGLLPNGCTVKIQGLSKSSVLNGMKATVMQRITMKDTSIEAYGIVITETGEQKKLKRTNLAESVGVGFIDDMWEIVHEKLKQVLGVADQLVGCTVDVAGSTITVHIIRAAMWVQMANLGARAGVVTDVGFLHVLRDQILSGDFERDFTQRLVKLVEVKAVSSATAAASRRWRLATLRDNPPMTNEGGKMATWEQAIAEVEREISVSTERYNLMSSIVAGTIDLKANTTAFAEMYERSMRLLKSLTPHQAEKWLECYDDDGSLLPPSDTHIQAPAGGGKTFLGMHIADNLLAGDSNATVLFAATNTALAFFFVNWICTRRDRSEEIRDVLQRLHVLTEDDQSSTPGSLVLQKFENRDGSLEIVRVDRQLYSPLPNWISTSAPLPNSFTIQEGGKPADYSLLIVDEAHHLYRDNMLRHIVEAHTGRTTRRILLSDVSQWSTAELDFPKCMTDVVLDQVVRNSRRIVAGARAFQTGNAAIPTECHHQSDGLPLRPILFDAVRDKSGRRLAYKENVVKALGLVSTQYPGLNLHNRVAIIGPDKEFVDQLQIGEWSRKW
jgi:hypothetical protein